MLTGIADAEGAVLFTNLDPIVYYIWAVKEETGGIWVSGGWVEALAQNETSMYNVPCVWLADETKKASTRYPDPVKLILREQ